MQVLPHAGPVFSAHLLGSILSCLHSGAMGLENSASHCRQVQAHPTHLCVACKACCQQKGSLLAGLLMECRQQYPQGLLMVVATSKINLADEQYTLQQQKNVFPMSSYPLLVLEQSNSLLEAELPTANRQLAAHVGLLSGRCPCLGPARLSGTEGTVGAALGTHTGTHYEKHGWGNPCQVDEQSQGALCTGLA